MHELTSVQGSPASRDTSDDRLGLSFLALAAVLPWTIAPMGIATAICALVASAIWLRDRGFPQTPINHAALGWALALVIATVFAVDPGGSLPRLKKALFPLLVLIAATHASDRRIGTRAVAVLLVSASLASVVGLWQVMGRTVDFDLRARGPVGHYMTYAGQLLLFVSLALGVTLFARRRAWRLGAAAAGLLGSAALIGTFTRSAWLGLVVSAGMILALWKPRWLAALGAVVVVLVVLAPASYRDRLASAFDPAHATNVERTHMWRAGLRMFADHPVTGVGLQDLHPLYEQYRDPDALEGAGHLHSVPIQVAASMGIVGLAALVWLIAALFRCTATGLRRTLRAGGLAAGVRLGVLGGLCGFLVAGLFEWNLGDEEVLYPLYALIGIAWAAKGWPDDEGDA